MVGIDIGAYHAIFHSISGDKLMKKLKKEQKEGRKLLPRKMRYVSRTERDGISDVPHPSDNTNCSLSECALPPHIDRWLSLVSMKYIFIPQFNRNVERILKWRKRKRRIK